MIVVDTNIIAYLCIEGVRTKQAETIAEKESEWVSPFLWRSEFLNVLLLYMRKQILSLKDAIEIMSKAVVLMSDCEYHVSHESVLKLAAHSDCSSYDCEFVALAEQLNISLVTADNKIVSNFPGVAISPEDFISKM